MGYQLVITKGRSSSAAHVLGPGTTVAGRQEGCTLLIKSSRVSRRHCELFEQQGQLIVRDLGSSNGTLVNGARINSARVLELGDELDIGGVQFRIERTAAVKSSAPRPSEGGAAPIVDESEELLLVEEEETEEPLLLEDAADEPATPTPPRTRPAAPPQAAKKEEDEAIDFLLAIDDDE